MLWFVVLLDIMCVVMCVSGDARVTLSLLFCYLIEYRIAGIFRGGKCSFFHQQIDFRVLYFRFCFISTIL